MKQRTNRKTKCLFRPPSFDPLEPTPVAAEAGVAAMATGDCDTQSELVDRFAVAVAHIVFDVHHTLHLPSQTTLSARRFHNAESVAAGLAAELDKSTVAAVAFAEFENTGSVLEGVELSYTVR
jgi:hypothetical protein